MMDAFLTGEVDSKNPYLELPQPRSIQAVYRRVLREKP